MRKLLKKVCIGIVGLIMSLIPMATISQGIASAETTNTAKPIDMYLIAGQSNAAGYSRKNIGQLTETFENVGYGGEVQRYFRELNTPSSSSYLTYDKFVWGVKAGLGASSGYVGPEYGIAKVINSQYENQPDGRKAFIFKTAAGGTPLRDVDDVIGTTTYNWGNWYPRSLWEEGYTPNTATNDPSNDATGYLYALFVENFERVYNELKDNGYAPVVKGFVWMQGCNDLGASHTLYESLLKTFIADMREDLAEITGDVDLHTMPFVIGEIATTFGYYGNVNVPSFNTMQRKVATDMGDSVATVPTADLIINNADGTINGTDIYHFNAPDAQILGERFGEKLLELNGKSFVSVSMQDNGVVKFTIDENGKITFTIEPLIAEKKYKLDKFYINNVDVTSDVADNTYIITEPEKRTYAKAEFVEMTKYNVTYNIDKKYVGVINGMKQVYENDDMTLELGVKEGYKITKVTINGAQRSSADADKHLYYLENVLEDIVIDVECESLTTNTPPQDTGNTGCAGSIATTSISVAVLGITAVGVTLFARKKKNK